MKILSFIRSLLLYDKTLKYFFDLTRCNKIHDAEVNDLVEMSRHLIKDTFPGLDKISFDNNPRMYFLGLQHSDEDNLLYNKERVIICIQQLKEYKHAFIQNIIKHYLNNTKYFLLYFIPSCFALFTICLYFYSIYLSNPKIIFTVKPSIIKNDYFDFCVETNSSKTVKIDKILLKYSNPIIKFDSRDQSEVKITQDITNDHMFCVILNCPLELSKGIMHLFSIPLKINGDLDKIEFQFETIGVIANWDWPAYLSLFPPKEIKQTRKYVFMSSNSDKYNEVKTVDNYGFILHPGCSLQGHGVAVKRGLKARTKEGTAKLGVMEIYYDKHKE